MNERNLFVAALRQPDVQSREAFLIEACGDDAALRENVEALLREHNELGSFLEAPAADIEITAAASNVPAERPGTIIGRYKLMEQIGEGGMGLVFIAEQHHPVRRKVALKLIKPGMDSRQVIARFEAERQALALMDHPNIARVIDGGTTASGRPYFVMELVKGVPITTYCDDRKLTPRQRLELFVPVCQAIQHAHQKGIIHRDIKPSNVLVAMYDDRPVPKVIDFGVAKATGALLTEPTPHTGFGAIVGTAEYMSPEQAGFNQLDVDTRSDIYSLGVLLYELLTGTTPLTKKRAKEAALLEVLRLVREEEPPRPSTRLSTTDELPSIAAVRGTEPARLSKLVRGELDWIVMKSLEKDRSRRYETANSFAADVQRYLADEPVQACPPSAGYRFRKFARRNKVSLAVAAFMLCFLILLGSGVGWAVRDREARQLAVEQEVNLAITEAERLQEQTKWMEALSAAKRAEGLLAGGGAAGLRDRVTQLRKDLEMVLRLEDIRLLSSEWKDDKFDHETADRAYAKAFADYGIDIANASADEAAERIRNRDRTAVALIAALDDWAFSRSQKKDGAGELALTTIAQAADLDEWRRKVRQASKQKDTKALVELAAAPEFANQPPTSHLLLARAMRTKRMLNQIIGVLRQAQRQHPGDFWINFELASVLPNSQRDEAIAFYRAALAVRPQSIAVRNNLSSRLMEQGKTDEAIAHLRTAIELDSSFLRGHLTLLNALRSQGKLVEAVDVCGKIVDLDPKSAWARRQLGNLLSEQGKADEAIAAYRKSIDLEPQNALAYNNLGMVFYRLKNFDEAIAAFRTAIDYEPSLTASHLYLGNALTAQGRFEDALTTYRNAVAIDTTILHGHNNIGYALRKLGKLDEAIAEFHIEVESHPDNALAYSNLGKALRDQGKIDAAVRYHRKAADVSPKSADAYIDLGNALVDNNSLNEAIECYRTAIKLDSANANAHTNLGMTLTRQRKLDEALVAIHNALTLDSKHSSAYDALGIVLVIQEKWEQAKDAYQNALKYDPRNAKFHYKLGCVMLDLKKPDEAIMHLQRAVNFDPRFGEAYNTLGIIFNDQNKLDEAIAAYRKAIKADSKSAIYHHNLGLALNRQRKYDDAIIAFRDALKLDPNDTVSLNGLGNAFSDQGKLDDAIATYRAVLKLNPSFAVSRRNLSRSLARKGWDLANQADPKLRDIDRALAIGKEAVEVAPEFEAPWQSFGWIQYRAGLWKESVDALEKSCKLQGGTGDPYQWIVLSMAHWQLGHKDEARKWYDQTMKLEKHWPEDLRRFRIEAEELMGIKESKN